MKKVLVYATGGQGFQEGSQLEEAICKCKEGSDVFYLTCGSCIGGCLDSPLFNKYRCVFCSFSQQHRAKKYIKGIAAIHSVNEYYSAEIKSIGESMIFDYQTVEDLKSLSYKGVAIGFGAMSSYISLTRNMNPPIIDSVKAYLDRLLCQQVILIEILDKIISSFRPDLIVFHNGRFAQYRPFLGLAQQKKIDFICTETLVTGRGIAMKNYFFNDIPHSAEANCEKYNFFWTSYPQVDMREKIARSFFENRRLGKYAGDKIYIKDQQQGKLPEEWDSEKDNIVIFNSSEDEFCAIDERVDNANIFGSQLEGIKAILDRYQNDESKNFYLRIHPNLKNISFDYHTELYKLSYKNLTVIPPDSSVSSYSLLDAADRVVVFGSTIGIEGAYWQKPVICLGYALYSLLEAVYIPQNEFELWNLLDDKNLKPKISDGILRYGLYYISEEHKHFRYVNNRVIIRKLGHKQWKCFSYMTFLNSSLLYKWLEGIFVKMTKSFNQFKYIP